MNTHTIHMNSLSLIAPDMKLQSDLLGPASIKCRIPPPPTPEKLVECMTVVACFKFVFKCVWLNPLALFRRY